MRWAGVDDVVLYDNGVDTSEQVSHLCEELGVRYHLWNERNSQDGKSTIKQWWAYKLGAYDHAAQHYQDYDWQIAFDMDEIPFAPEDQEAGYLRRVLQEHALQNPGVSEWSFKNYIFVGAPSTKGPLFKRYVRRNDGPHNNLNKPIYKPQCIKALFHHNRLTCGTSKEFDASKMRMNHYWGGRLSDWGELSQSQMENTIEDTSILPMMNEIFESALKVGPGPHRRVVIGIPTIARKGNPDYLRRTLVSIQQHGFPMDAVYVMHANDAPHPIFESVRAEFALHLVEPSNQSISIEYTPTRLEDSQVKTALRDSPHQKQWRIREARDWRHLMETMLRTTNADFVVFNQDDGEWIGPYPSPLEPITSLWSTCDGMVSFVFERATLRKFLDWMAVDDRWKEKPIDWTLNDFVKEFGYKIPVHRIVRHIGKIRSIVT